MLLEELSRIIEQKRACIGVIGLGYVGLPVACVFADAGFDVIGLDINSERVAEINASRLPFDGDEPGLAAVLAEVRRRARLRATSDYALMADANVVLIAVETPVDADHVPRYTALRAACQSLGSVMQPGTLVIIESTVAPGTVQSVVRPVLEGASGLRANRDFYLGACPERVMPGKLLANLHHMSRVCGGGTPETASVMTTLYRHIVHAELDAADIVTAELVKTTENAYRDVQIAFANEVALICEANNANAWRVRELVNKSPYRHMHLPGAGVGGHCIPKDPWLLAYGAGDTVPVRLIPTARAVNDSMPLHVANLTITALREAGRIPSQSRVAVLGYSYLDNSDDTRNSPSIVLVERLRQQGIAVVIHDPWVTEYQGDLLERIMDADAIVVMVGHRDYRSIDLDALKNVLRSPVIIDGRGLYDAHQIRAAGLIYRGIGKGAGES
jgi:UDP-N-acetyl-D-mannosaminuronic acid dehydrogenase